MQGNIHSFPPNIDPQVFALLAALVGSALSGDFDAYEQSSIGNWLMLVGEYMLTAAAQQQLIEARIQNFNININSREYKNGGSFYANNGKSNQNQRDEVDFLLNAIEDIKNELENIKRNNKI